MYSVHVFICTSIEFEKKLNAHCKKYKEKLHSFSTEHNPDNKHETIYHCIFIKKYQEDKKI